jgi:hypothetical protein
MPKNEIDYSNTIIYKITCKNSEVKDVYVGHTTNFVQRKHAHKQSCINAKSPNHNCKLYEVIRANGGWVNWQMEIINFFDCADHYAARKKEQEYFIELNATLNSIEPFPKPKVITTNVIVQQPKPIYFCNTCNIKCDNSKAFDTHTKTNKHLKISQKDEINNSPKLAKKFSCKCCNYGCSKESDYKKHLATRKHEKLINDNRPITEKPQKFICSLCSKEYKSNVGLWKHKKICKEVKPVTTSPIYMTQAASITQSASMPPDVTFFTNLVLEVVKNNAELQKQNQDFQKQMLEIYKTTNNVTNNSHSYNKTFNMQLFLNETCKDAMNIMDFVNTMTLEFTDLEEVGKVGYVEGISNIIIRKLNALDVHKRPIHCSDSKREIMYVKDENIWEKENSNYDKLRKAIKHVTCKNSALLGPWSKEHPQCMNNQHHLNDVYVQMMGQAMGGKESFLESENKIMKKIAKAVLIDKV